MKRPAVNACRYLLALSLLFNLALVLWIAEDAQAARDTHTITQRVGFHGLIVECRDTLPYRRIEPLCYENGAWCENMDTTQTRHAVTVIEVASCDALTNVYRNPAGAFALEGLQIGSDGQPHPTRGAYWIEATP